MPYNYAGSRVVVTGSSSGIGAATARALAAAGARVHGLARRDSTAGLASFTTLDLTDPASIEMAAATIEGPVHALFNCAGANPLVGALDILAVNFLGTRLLTERIVPLMTPGSAIVNVSSDSGYAWRRRQSLATALVGTSSFEEGLEWYKANTADAGHPYSFAKEALNIWTMWQSRVLIRDGIRINALSPGAVETPMLAEIEKVFPAEMIDAVTDPIGRRSTPDEQVGPLLFLNSDAASYVNGIDLQVDGGFWATQTLAGNLH
ncbi:coniferyl-alcohol dehydrogenase [Nocardia bovistercoris]|uniref:Coniferyl-alcohol dehydrogenase n=1 Tax=Nocardia bovistercoris TaxID=2785916 RepID=A0A931IFS3_9NOCA|nr:coniferyl-alcohol dehydrogenase [Nocardia bovistercoris]MBH0779743.1 coniferyl-alcohol dehydrogenase [Nocardia bovistercoris]